MRIQMKLGVMRDNVCKVMIRFALIDAVTQLSKINLNLINVTSDTHLSSPS